MRGLNGSIAVQSFELIQKVTGEVREHCCNYGFVRALHCRCSLQPFALRVMGRREPQEIVQWVTAKAWGNSDASIQYFPAYARRPPPARHRACGNQEREQFFSLNQAW